MSVIVSLTNVALLSQTYTQQKFVLISPSDTRAYRRSTLLNTDSLLPKRISKRVKPTFTRAQFFASHTHSQRVHSAAAGPRSTALYTKEREG